MTQHHNILTVINSPDFSTASVEIIVFALLRLLKQPFCRSLRLVVSVDDVDRNDLVPFDAVGAMEGNDE